VHILVINSGSSSVKFSIFDAVPHRESDREPEPVIDGAVSGIGGGKASLQVRRGDASPTQPTPDPAPEPTPVNAKTSLEAIRLVLDYVSKPGIPPIDAIGYRVVHPGPKLNRHQLITDTVLADLEAAVVFAPLHDPDAIRLIREAMARFPHIPHFACFDTVFHQTMPEAATTYPIPLKYAANGVRRYGFHGLSCESVVRRMRLAAGMTLPKRMIIAHLGSGCSITALIDGKSVDTTMGLTPTGGIVMGTRPGDLDPGLILYLLREKGATVDSVEQMLNHDAGIKAIFGINDMRKLRDAAAQNPKAQLAIEIFCTSARRAIGGMVAVHGADAIVFTGGIGEHDARTRWALGNWLFGDQPEMEWAANEAKLEGMRKISAEESNIAVYVVPAEEDLMIAVHVARMSASEGL
jgi:acetate kinase